MAAPTNVTALTAIDIGSLPTSITQRVDDSGTIYTVWYKYTPITGNDDIGLWGYGGIGGNYNPTVEVFLGPAATPVDYLGGYFAFNVPIVIPVNVGVTLYFSFTPDGADSGICNLTLSVLDAPKSLSAANRILITEF